MTDWSADMILERLRNGGLSDPFGVFGMHDDSTGGLVVRVFLPWASRVGIVEIDTGKGNR